MKLNSIFESYFKKQPNIGLPWWLSDKVICLPMKETQVRSLFLVPVASVTISIPNSQSDVSLSSGSKHERPIVTAMPSASYCGFSFPFIVFKTWAN